MGQENIFVEKQTFPERNNSDFFSYPFPADDWTENYKDDESRGKS
jgi:hypothetical protein